MVLSSLFSASTITGNAASIEGGGLWNQLGSSLFLDSATTVTNNNSRSNGGGIYNRGGLTAIDTAFASNSSADGGAIYNTQSGSTQIEDSTLDDNFATNGGGVFNLGNVVTLGSMYRSNFATNTGGAFFNGPDAVTTIGLDNLFAGNLPNDQNDDGSLGGPVTIFPGLLDDVIVDIF